jgi:hypothetical protein
VAGTLVLEERAVVYLVKSDRFMDGIREDGIRENPRYFSLMNRMELR